MPSLVRACVRTRTTQSLGGIFPFHDRSPVERQIAAGEFVFPDEYFNTVSNDGTCRIRKAADEDVGADDRSASRFGHARMTQRWTFAVVCWSWSPRGGSASTAPWTTSGSSPPRPSSCRAKCELKSALMYHFFPGAAFLPRPARVPRSARFFPFQFQAP